MQHPQETDTDETDDGVLTEPEELEAVVDLEGDPLLPDCAMDAEDVAVLNVPYSTRAPDDWVSSGTLDPTYAEKAAKHGWRSLRYYATWDDAEKWAREFFGERFKGRIQEAVDSGASRWCFLIKGPRGESVYN